MESEGFSKLHFFIGVCRTLMWSICPFFLRIQYYTNILNAFFESLPIHSRRFCNGFMMVLWWFCETYWSSVLGLQGIVMFHNGSALVLCGFLRFHNGFERFNNGSARIPCWFCETFWGSVMVSCGFVGFHNGFVPVLQGIVRFCAGFCTGLMMLLWGFWRFALFPQGLVRFCTCSTRLSEVPQCFCKILWSPVMDQWGFLKFYEPL